MNTSTIRFLRATLAAFIYFSLFAVAHFADAAVLSSQTNISDLDDIGGLSGAPSLVQILAPGLTGKIDNVYYWVRANDNSTGLINFYECNDSAAITLATSTVLQNGCSIVATSTYAANLTEHPRNPTYPDTPIEWASSTFATKYLLNPNKFYAIVWRPTSAGTQTCGTDLLCPWGNNAAPYGYHALYCDLSNAGCTTESWDMYFILNGNSLSSLTSQTDISDLDYIGGLAGRPSLVQVLAPGLSGTIDNVYYWVRANDNSAGLINFYECNDSAAVTLATTTVLQNGCSVIATSSYAANLPEHPRNPNYPDTPIEWASSTFATKYSMNASKYYALVWRPMSGGTLSCGSDLLCPWGNIPGSYGYHSMYCALDNTTCITESRDMYFILHGY